MTSDCKMDIHFVIRINRKNEYFETIIGAFYGFLAGHSRDRYLTTNVL